MNSTEKHIKMLQRLAKDARKEASRAPNTVLATELENTASMLAEVKGDLITMQRFTRDLSTLLGRHT